MWNRLKLWWRAEGDLAQLRGLTDGMLADMGLRRGDLRALVHGRRDPALEPPACDRHPLRALPLAR